jgi:hypothetical protein
MKMLVCSLSAGFLLATAASTQAQDTPAMVSLVTYYQCAQGDTARADAIVKEHMLPVLKAEQAAGRITAYGWSEHVEGGEWRRLLRMAGTDLGKLLEVRDAQAKMRQSAEHAKAIDEFGRLCPTHDDYLWRTKSTSQAAADVGRVRSPYAMSTYYECGSDEAEADAIVASTFAPVLTKRVKDGTVASWNWLEHLFGGKYRRLLVIDGKDEKTLLANWATLQDDLEKASPQLARRFSQICHSHADYVWKVDTN